MACSRLPAYASSVDGRSASRTLVLSGRLAVRGPLMPHFASLAHDQPTWHGNEPGGISCFAHKALHLLTLCLALTSEINIDNNKSIGN